MSLRHAILGFLSFAPLTGYDLKKAFDRSVQHFWPANQSQIYRTLAELTEDGLIDKEVIERGDRLDMKVYHLTPAGRQELQRWLSTPIPPPDTRDPFLIQIFFGGQLTDAELLGLIESQRQAAEALLDVYRRTHAASVGQTSAVADERALFLSHLTLEFGLKSCLMYRDWLLDAHARLQAGQYRPLDLSQILGEAK